MGNARKGVIAEVRGVEVIDGEILCFAAAFPVELDREEIYPFIIGLWSFSAGDAAGGGV